MKKIIFPAFFLLLAAAATPLHAQSLRNTAWKTLITLTLHDYDGPYFCPDADGKSRINLKDDQLILVLIDDSCEGRAGSINGIKWIKAPAGN